MFRTILSAAELPHLRGLRIGVIEPRAPQSIEEIKLLDNRDLRTFAISPGSQKVLAEAGVWDTIQSTRVSPYYSMQVWDSLSPGFLHFTSELLGTNKKELGHIIENRVLQSALFDRLVHHSKLGNVDLMCPNGFAQIEHPTCPTEPQIPFQRRSLASTSARDGLSKVTLTDGSVVEARLVVAADGADSKVRSTANIGTWGWSYDQHGLCATVKTSGHKNIAWQRFLPHGPIAVLPLTDNHASIVWSTNANHAKYLKSLSPAEFVAAANSVLTAPITAFERIKNFGIGSSTVNAQEDNSTVQYFNKETDIMSLNPFDSILRMGRNFGEQLAKVGGRSIETNRDDAFLEPPQIVDVVGPCASFPLRFSQANVYVKPRLALIGDAAHAVHPLAGLGLNMGLADADSLATTLSKHIQNGSDIGSLSVLNDYEIHRASHNLFMMTGLDLIKRAFAGTPDMINSAGASLGINQHLLEPLIVSRSIGLGVIQNSPLLKSIIARSAFGQ